MSGSGKPITGYLTIVEPDRPLVERDTITCGHCQRIIITKANSGSTVYLVVDRATNQIREEPGAFCRHCMRPVCLSPRCLAACLVWEQQLERSESRDRLRRAAGV